MPDDRVKAALDRLADVLGAVGVHGRLLYKMLAVRALLTPGCTRDQSEFWHALDALVDALDDEETGQSAAPVAAEGV